MIEAGEFLQCLKDHGTGFFTGVPDSLMKRFLLTLEKEPNHIVTANEGAAVAMATGYHLATGKIGLVYLQNSGLGNIVNPLTSLTSSSVYGIPMLLMIGWRGEPGIKDEPQHKLMGAITPGLLDLIQVPYFIFSSKQQLAWKDQLKKAMELASGSNQPVALLIEEGFFLSSDMPALNEYELSAEYVLNHLYQLLDDSFVVVATTGKIGRLFYDINLSNENRISKFFMNVGAMGHASSIAASLARFSGDKIVLLDGDGSLLMHMGSLATIGSMPLKNFHYVVLNNGAHQSVGGQKTVGFDVDFCTIAKGCGFEQINTIKSQKELDKWKLMDGAKSFTEIRINTEMPLQLSRPSESFSEAKMKFMNAINSYEPGTADQ